MYVAGGAGIVGSGIVRNLIENGARVWVTSRNEANLNQLKAVIPDSLKSNLNLHKANVSNPSECEQVKNEIIKKENKIDHVIASIGSFWNKGTLSTQNADELRKILDEHAVSHFTVYKTFSNYLSKQSNKTTYTFITGGLGEICALPQVSLLTVGQSTVYGLYQAAIAEHKANKNFSLNEIRYYMWIRNKLDKEFEAKKANMEVGNDWTAKFVSKIIVKNKTGQYKITNRKKGDELYETL